MAPPVASPLTSRLPAPARDRKSTRLNSSHTVIYTLSLHDALPILQLTDVVAIAPAIEGELPDGATGRESAHIQVAGARERSEEHTSELQSHRDLHSFPTRRSSDLATHRCSCYRSSDRGRAARWRHRSRVRSHPGCRRPR